MIPFYKRIQAGLTGGILLVAGCATIRPPTPLSEEAKANITELVAKAKAEDAKCTAWAQGLELNFKPSPQELKQYRHKYESDPGPSSAASELRFIFLHSEMTEGFPHDFSWDWQNISDLGHCENILRFSLASRLVEGFPPTDRALAKLLLTRLENETEGYPTLMNLLMSGSTIDKMVERGFLTQLSDVAYFELVHLMSALENEKQKTTFRFAEARRQIEAVCKMPETKCPNNEHLRLWGRAMADEGREIRTLSQWLHAWIQRVRLQNKF